MKFNSSAATTPYRTHSSPILDVSFGYSLSHLTPFSSSRRSHRYDGQEAVATGVDAGRLLPLLLLHSPLMLSGCTLGALLRIHTINPFMN